MPDSILLQGCEEAMLEQRRRLHVAHAGVAVCVSDRLCVRRCWRQQQSQSSIHEAISERT